jgi:hypothetical protein
MGEIETRTKPQPLASERVIINAPMSFAGATQRAMRMRETAPDGPARWLLTAAVVLLVLPLWWGVILVWYVFFSIFLIPYRLLRRGARKRKAEALRHQEMLDAVSKR